MISLIICTYRRPRQVSQLLRAITAQERVPDEILVVDASPDSATATVVTAFQHEGLANLTYYLAPTGHRGLTRQRNYGIERTRGDLIAFLDDDTIPEPDYFAELEACFARYPEALGVGGYIVDELAWQPAGAGEPNIAVYRYGAWECRDDYRWRLRKLLGLDSPLPPGWMPRFGHGRTLGRIPPDDKDHRVEYIMGCAQTWRSSIFSKHQFSHYFEGYGLYEDLDFCIRASRDGSLYLCTRARLAHHHAPSGRPNHFRYGVMVVRNGWFVWQRRWPAPSVADAARWWAITLLLLACRLGDAVRLPGRRAALAEALGRGWGTLQVLVKPPRDTT